MIEDDFLAKYVFYDIENLNKGIDVESIMHFSYNDLEKVMCRVESHYISILGIEFWSETEILEVLFHEDYPGQPNWHRAAIASLDPEQLHNYLFAVTFNVPEKML